MTLVDAAPELPQPVAQVFVSVFAETATPPAAVQTTGSPTDGAAPVPLRATEAAAPPVRASVPVTAPAAVGEKRTVITALWFAASEYEAVPTTLKGAEVV